MSACEQESTHGSWLHVMSSWTVSYQKSQDWVISYYTINSPILKWELMMTLYDVMFWCDGALNKLKNRYIYMWKAAPLALSKRLCQHLCQKWMSESEESETVDRKKLDNFCYEISYTNQPLRKRVDNDITIIINSWYNPATTFSLKICVYTRKINHEPIL